MAAGILQPVAGVANLLSHVERLWTNLQGLGVRRLVALAVIGLSVFAVTGLAGYYPGESHLERFEGICGSCGSAV
jgi:hypothetical protein